MVPRAIAEVLVLLCISDGICAYLEFGTGIMKTEFGTGTMKTYLRRRMKIRLQGLVSITNNQKNVSPTIKSKDTESRDVKGTRMY